MNRSSSFLVLLVFISASYMPNRCHVLGVVDSTFSESLRGWAEKWEKNLLPAIPKEPPRSLSGF